MSKGPPFDSRGNKNQNNALTALARKGSKYESARSPDLSSPSIPGKKTIFVYTGTLISKADKIRSSNCRKYAMKLGQKSNKKDVSKLTDL